MSDICPVCGQPCVDSDVVNHEEIQCMSCCKWVHHNNRKNCSGLTNREFKKHLQSESKFWECDICHTKSNSSVTLPFCHFEENDWLSFHDFNKKQTCSDDVNVLSTQSVKFASHCETIKEFLNSESEDADDNILSNHINCKYYDDKQFNSLKVDLPSSFGMFHANIASLNKHIDDLKFILTKLNYNFDIIGISEHKIQKGISPSNNISIPGYDQFIFEPTETTHGGTGFYIRDNIDYIKRDDLQINSPGNFESTFVEIQFSKNKNLVVGCIYRHPSSSISVSDFTNVYLQPVLQKISDEKKQCVLMGDFNINLLSTDTNTVSNEFYNELASHFFSPYIISY